MTVGDEDERFVSVTVSASFPGCVHEILYLIGLEIFPGSEFLVRFTLNFPVFDVWCSPWHGSVTRILCDQSIIHFPVMDYKQESLTYSLSKLFNQIN